MQLRYPQPREIKGFHPVNHEVPHPHHTLFSIILSDCNKNNRANASFNWWMQSSGLGFHCGGGGAHSQVCVSPAHWCPGLQCSEDSGAAEQEAPVPGARVALAAQEQRAGPGEQVFLDRRAR